MDTNLRNDSMESDVVPTRDGYDRWSLIYDVEDNPLIALDEAAVPDLLGDTAGLRLLELGCGTGRHTLRLAKAGARVTAIDFSEGMLNKARAKPGADAVRFLCHDLSQPLPFGNAAFDCVLCALVLDHISALRLLFGEMRRVCARDGYIVVSVMHPDMMLCGLDARFTDPRTGRRTRPESAPNRMSDYIMAIVESGLRIDHMAERVVDDALAERMDRAAKYRGWPLLLTFRLRPA